MSSPCADPPRRQRGVALITVMLVFVLATMMATQMLRTGYMAIHRTGNLVDSTQARYYALGAEELGKQMLGEDARTTVAASGPIDHLGEPWAASSLNFPIDDGAIELTIEDLAGRFNINNLADASGKTDPVALARFARLLRTLDIDPVFADAAADSVDKDTGTRRGGSEDSAYSVRLPNQPLADASELRALPGLDAEEWSRLAPMVSALPPGTGLNVNTAPAEVLAAYATKVGMAEVERFVHSRQLQPIRDANDPALLKLFPENRDQVTVQSGFFVLRVHAVYRERHARFETRVQREPRTGKMSVLARSDAARL